MSGEYERWAEDAAIDFAEVAIGEGMSPLEAASAAARRATEMALARARVSPPVGSVGMLGGEANNPTDPTGGERGVEWGLVDLTATADSKGDIEVVVDGLIVEGLTLFAGAPKIGKSYMCLDIAYGVAAGTPVLGQMVPDPGDVLYLALEDHSKRLVARLAELEPSRGEWPMKRLTVIPLDSDHARRPGWVMEKWAEEVERPRLVIVDTLTRFGGQGDRSGYRADVEWIAKFHRFATERNIGILGVTHTNQMKFEEGDDWFYKISGTSGITGTADNAILLDGKRGEPEAVVKAAGRDIEDKEIAVRRVGPWWQVSHMLRGNLGDRSVEIVDFIILQGEATTADVAERLSISPDQASVYLGRLVRSGRIRRVSRGRFAALDAPTEGERYR